MADLIKGYKVSYAAYSASTPTTWTELVGCVRNLPNFFPEPETVDTTTIDMTQRTSIPGLEGQESYPLTICPNAAFMAAHDAMVADQSDSAKGYFWMQFEITNRGKKYTGKFKTVEKLPTPEGAAGDLDEVDVGFYPQGDLIEADIT